MTIVKHEYNRYEFDTGTALWFPKIGVTKGTGYCACCNKQVKKNTVVMLNCWSDINRLIYIKGNWVGRRKYICNDCVNELVSCLSEVMDSLKLLLAASPEEVGVLEII